MVAPRLTAWMARTGRASAKQMERTMKATGTLKYGLRPTVRLADNITPFSALLPLKADDPDGHAKAIAEMVGAKEFGEAVSEMALIHVFSLTRVGDNLLFQTNFDSDVVAYFEAFIDLEEPLRQILAHLEGAPDAHSDFTAVLEYIAAHQLDVVAYFCAYPELTVNQIRRDADWRGKLVELQKSLARPADNAVQGQVAAAI